MQKSQSGYEAWTWIVAFLLTLVLFWLLVTQDHAACCHAQDTSSTSTLNEVDSRASIVTEAFSFSASANGFTSTGDTSNITWVNDSAGLNTLLGSSLKAEGDDHSITLTGTVSTEAEKQQKNAEAQAFFGRDVAINNQISITADPIDMAPPLAKIFFDSGYHRLPDGSETVLAPTIRFLQNNPEKRAIISGYHDATGDLVSNQKLAKKRAQAVYDALIAANIPTDSIEMRKPVSTDGGGDLNEARRVEVSIE